MTTGKITLDAEDKRLSVHINFFFDDFQEHLKDLYQIDIVSLDSTALRVMEDYVIQNFQVRINHSESEPFALIGAEWVGDNVVQILLKSLKKSNSKINALNITNTLLFDVFPEEQSNILHIAIASDEEIKILRFSIQEGVQSIEWR